jgi:hypothetical protein
MKRSYLILLAAVAALLALVSTGRSTLASKGRVRQGQVEIKSIQIKSIIAHKPARNARTITIALKPAGTIPLEFLKRAPYLSRLKFDGPGNIYLRTYAPEERKDQIEWFKLDATTLRYEKIAIPGIGADEHLGEIAVGDYGKVYAALALPTRRGAMAVIAPNGSLVSRIDTGSFIVHKLVVDRSGRLWTSGQLFEASAPDAKLADSQIRVYDQNGQLLGVPLGGLEVGDSSLSEFAADDGGVKFISHSQSALYQFVDTSVESAYQRPFHSSTDIRQENLRPTSPEDRRHVDGIAELGQLRLWWGKIETEDGTARESFVGITTARGEALTPEVKLPAEYAGLAGVDGDGNIYAYSRNGDNIGLKKARLILSDK